MKLVKKDKFRSNSRKVNEDYDMVRLVIDCHFLDYIQYIKPLLEKHIGRSPVDDIEEL